MTQILDLPSPRIQLYLRAAEHIGLRWRLLDEEFGYFYELSDGNRSVAVSGARSPLNSTQAHHNAEVKYYTHLLLRDAGFRTPKTIRCVRGAAYGRLLGLDSDQQAARERASIDAALNFARERGQVIVKPNTLGRGQGVRVVYESDHLETAIRELFKLDDSVLVQEIVAGVDLRVDMVDGELIVAYVRTPIRFEGDGRSSVRELLIASASRFSAAKLQTQVTSSAAWRAKVDHAGYTLDGILPRGVVIDLGPVLNLNVSANCAPLDALPPGWLDYIHRAGKVLGIRHFGVDLRVPGELDTVPPHEASIIEFNSSPLLFHLELLGHGERALAGQAKVWAALFGR